MNKIKKYIKLIILTFLLIPSFSFATNWYAVDSQHPLTNVTIFGNCYDISVSSSDNNKYFVPAKTQDEWDAFKTYKPNTVTVDNCSNGGNGGNPTNPGNPTTNWVTSEIMNVVNTSNDPSSGTLKSRCQNLVNAVWNNYYSCSKVCFRKGGKTNTVDIGANSSCTTADSVSITMSDMRGHASVKAACYNIDVGLTDEPGVNWNSQVGTFSGCAGGYAYDIIFGLEANIAKQCHCE